MVERNQSEKVRGIYCCTVTHLFLQCVSLAVMQTVYWGFCSAFTYVWKCVGKGKGATAAKAERQVEDAEDKLLHDYQQQIVQEERGNLKKTKVKAEEESIVSQKITLNNDGGKKKKKKLKSVNAELEIGCVYLLIWFLNWW